MDKDLFAGKPGAYTYTQSRNSKTAEGVLVKGKGLRNAYAQRTVGGVHRGREDDGFHLIASRCRGSGEKENLEAVHRDVNRKSYKRMENRLARLLSDRTNTVHMKASSCRREGIDRPDAILTALSLRRGDGSVDREYRSFPNLSHREQEELQKTLYAQELPGERTSPEAARYAEQTVEMPLGTADVYVQKRSADMKGNCRDPKFENSLRVSEAVRKDLSNVLKEWAKKPAAAKAEDHARQRTLGDEGGREMGERTRAEAAKKPQARTDAAAAEKVGNIDQIFAARKQANAAKAAQTGSGTGTKGKTNSFIASLAGRSSGKGASAGAGRGFGRGSAGGRGASAGGKGASVGGRGSGAGISGGRSGGIGR